MFDPTLTWLGPTPSLYSSLLKTRFREGPSLRNPRKDHLLALQDAGKAHVRYYRRSACRLRSLHLSCQSLRPVWLLLAGLTSGGGPTSVTAAPVCANGQAGCRVRSLANLFDRVIQHSARMHGISDDLHSDFEQFFVPSRNHIGRLSRNCHTAHLITPDGKENAQRIAREELTEVILKLLVAWRDPLWHFHQMAAHHHDPANFSSDKALEMSDMVRELRIGVEKVAQKMQTLGMISNSVSSPSSPEDLAPSGTGEWRLMKDHELLYCFRRDSDKIQNYLKILKCRIVPDHGC
ncbi:prolactin 2 isoform X2 [Syngnathoides biaculeatus]|nr:prolactin 2 isoform X2 [Syngnathoides biaculeatus]